MPFDSLGYWVPPTTVHPMQLSMPLPHGMKTRFDPIPPRTTLTPTELLDKYYSNQRKDPVVSSGFVVQWQQPNALVAWPNALVARPVPMYGVQDIFDGTQVTVEFKHGMLRYPSLGVSMGHLFNANSSVLQGANDIVLGKFWKQRLELRISWPGYDVRAFKFSVVGSNSGRGPMSRFELGRQIAMAYGNLFRSVEQNQMLPTEIGFHNIALRQGRNAGADSLGVQFVQVHLVRFRNTMNGIWVADVEIV